MIIGLGVLLLIFMIIYLLTRKKSPGSAPPGLGKVYSLGRDLFISREEYPYPEYVNEGKRRLEILFNNIPFQLAGYDKKAIMSIAAWETGFISDPNARSGVVEKNNILGISDNPQGTILKTFNSTYQSIEFFKHMIEDYQRYYPAFLVRGNGPEFINKLWTGGYNTEISWKNGILSIYNNW